MFGPSDHKVPKRRSAPRLTVVGATDRPQALRPLTVLYVEDDADDVFLMRRHLAKSAHFQVELVHASTLDTARTLTAEHAYDVVFCDFWLGGDTTVPLIDELARATDAAVVLVSSLENEDIELIGRRAGAAGFVAKDDLSAAALDRILNTLLPAGVVADAVDARQAGGVGPWLRALMRTLDAAGPVVGATTDEAFAGRFIADLSAVDGSLRGDVIDRLADLDRASRRGGPVRFDAVPYLTDAVATLRVRGGRAARIDFLAPYLPVPLVANPAIFTDLLHGFFVEALDLVRAGRPLVVTPQVVSGALLVRMTADTAPHRAPVDGSEAARTRAAADARRMLVETLAQAAGGHCGFGAPSAPFAAILSVPLRPPAA